MAEPLTHPADVDPESCSRLPLVKRADLDERGQRAYDAVVDPNSPLHAKLRGPTAFWLYLPELVEPVRQINAHLRKLDNGLERRHIELAILVTARACDCQEQWTAHEPAALKAGLDPKVVEIVKHRRPVSEVPETEAAIIGFGRELFRDRKVSAATYAGALKVLGRRRLIHLIAMMANYAMTWVIYGAIDQQVHPGHTPLLPIP